MRQESINKVQSWALAWYCVQERINEAKQYQKRYEVLTKDILFIVNQQLYSQVFPPTDEELEKMHQPLSKEELEDADKFFKHISEVKTISGQEIISASETPIKKGLVWSASKEKKKVRR